MLDASFAIAWVIESERTPLAMKYFDALSLKQSAALVPAIWPDELANVLVTLDRSKKIASNEVSTWIQTFQRLPIQIEPVSLRHSLEEVRVLAQAHRLTVYDARYLHLALLKNLPLATYDKQLIAVATEAGVDLVN